MTATNPGSQWRALSGRSVLGGIREGDLVFATFTPVVFFVCFYVPLQNMADTLGVNYAQYLLPVIVLQSMLFTGIAAGERSATDALGGMAVRLRALPVPRLIPMFARMSANLIRAVLSLIGGIAIGYLAGFRFHGGLGSIIGFVVIALLFAVAMSFGADALGSIATNREATGQMLMVPQLLFTMVSTGIVPAVGFPEWLQPFARNQPVSKVADALRGLASDTVDATTITIALAWILGMLVVFASAALHLATKER
ncbi:MAG TPA: ABC transporter permease [Aldersonia sp.]